MKTVKRTWRDKRGNIHSKIYIYDYNYNKDLVRHNVKDSVLTKTGKIKKTKIETITKQVAKEKGWTRKGDFLEIKLTAETLAKGGSLNSIQVAIERVKASVENDTLSGMLVNTGFTLEQLAEMANTTVKALQDANNWSNNYTVFTNERKEQYEFTFSYDGNNIFKKVS